MANILWIWPAGHHESDLLTFCTYFMPCRSSLGWTEREPDTKNNCSNVIVVDAMLLLRFSHNRLKIDDGNMPDNRQSRLLLFVNRKRTFRFNHNSKFGSKRWTDERNTFFFSVFLLRIKLGNKNCYAAVSRSFCLFDTVSNWVKCIKLRRWRRVIHNRTEKKEQKFQPSRNESGIMCVDYERGLLFSA